MQIVDNPRKLNSRGRKICLAIGVFDGVHLGHQQVLGKTITDARDSDALSVAVTFDRHPSAVVAPDREPQLIYSLAKRLRVVGELGVEASLVIRFDKAFSEKTGEDFVRELADELGALRSVCVGESFVFGHQRAGNLKTLESMGEALGFAVFGLPSVSVDQTPVSSTRIRAAIGTGDLPSASRMLGRPYSLAAPVGRGAGLGRQLGYPTANLETRGLALPPKGVYAAFARARHADYRAVMNIGCRPTLNGRNSDIRVEAHLLDFEGDVYGEEIELTLVKRLRDEQAFPSVGALKSQISRDAALARSLLG